MLTGVPAPNGFGGEAGEFTRSGLDATVALSWVLTWFTRCFTDLDVVVRVFDFILATDPTYMPVYLAAAVRRWLRTGRGGRGEGAIALCVLISPPVQTKAATSPRTCQIILSRRQRLLRLEREFSVMFQHVTMVPVELSAERLVETAWRLYAQYPVRELGARLRAGSSGRRGPASPSVGGPRLSMPVWPAPSYRIVFAGDDDDDNNNNDTENTSM